MIWPSLLAQISEREVNIPRPDFTDNTLPSILRVVFALAGSAALIILIITGLKYNLSLGDPQKTAKAKNAIIYAGVGLAVCVLAFTIISFVLANIQ